MLQHKRWFVTDSVVGLYGRNVDVHRLRVLRAVVADGSVQGAAASLGYTPSAISQHLAALQRETGLALVEKAGRGITPTAAGVALADGAEPVFTRLAELDALVGDLRAGRVGTLSVSYFASAGAAWIPPVVATVAREFPRLRLDLRLEELADPEAGPPDVAIVVDGARPLETSGVRVHHLVTEPYLVVVPAGSPLAAADRLDLATLREQVWVDNDVARGPCREAVLGACRAAGFTPVFHVETQDYPTAIRVVAEGLGITVVPRLGLGDLPAGAVAVPLVRPTPTRSVSVRVRDVVADHPAVQRVLALLEERARGATTGRPG